MHCALSQVRGPACAARLANRAAAAAAATEPRPPIRISVLHGGFDAWYEEIGVRDALTEEPGK